MLRVFIGYDSRETIAYHVASHSILRWAKQPVAISPVCKDHFSFWTRKRDENQSTDFAYTRFLVPYLCDYQGPALFMDCDVLVRADLGLLFDLFDPRYAVQVVKHDYEPRTKSKFLEQPQTKYKKKNWSSVMLFNTEKCEKLVPEYVNTASGMDLHQFKWCKDNEVGELPNVWNHLVGEEGQCDPQDAKIVHYTLGTPCFAAYANGKPADWWYTYKQSMMYHDRKQEYAGARTPE